MKIGFYVAVMLTAFAMHLSAADVIRPSTTDLPKLSNPSAAAGAELSMLDHLIDVTQQNLDSLKQLRGLVADYLQLQQQYTKNTQDKKLSYQMVTTAYQVLEKIKEQHLTQTFDQEFMSELTFFANIASKWNNPS